jgi:hypothetical protein
MTTCTHIPGENLLWRVSSYRLGLPARRFMAMHLIVASDSTRSPIRCYDTLMDGLRDMKQIPSRRLVVLWRSASLVPDDDIVKTASGEAGCRTMAGEYNQRNQAHTICHDFHRHAHLASSFCRRSGTLAGKYQHRILKWRIGIVFPGMEITRTKAEIRPV